MTVTFDTVRFDDGITEYVLKGDINRDAPDKTEYTVDDIQVVNAETKSGDNVGPFPSSPKSLNVVHTVEGAVIAVKANAPSPATVTADNAVGDNGSEQIVAEIELDATDSGDDILVTEVKFDLTANDNGAANSFDNADVTNCSLEGSTDTEDAGTSMTFSLNETVSKDTKKTLLVKCDIGSDADAASADTISLANIKFDAEGVTTGTNFNNTAGTGTPSVTVTAPVLTAKEHADNPDAFAVMENESNIIIGVMEVEADDGDVKIDTITASLSETDIADNGKIKVYIDGTYEGDITVTADATAVASEALNVTVKDGEKVKVEFKIDAPTTAPTNNTGTLTVTAINLAPSGTGDITALTPNPFNAVTVVSAMPIVTEVNDSDITLTTSAVSDKRVLEFSVKADGGDVRVDQIVYSLDAGDIEFSNAEVKVYSDASYNNEVQADSVALITGGTAADATANITDVTISEGDTYYFVLETDMTASSGDSRTIQVKDAAGSIVFNPALNSQLVIEDDIKTTISTAL